MRERIKIAAATLTTFAALILAWRAAIWIFELPPYILPPPSAVARALMRGWIEGLFWRHAAYTLSGAMAGLALGAALGVLVGVLAAETRIARLAIYPLVIAIQSMPTIAIAPLIVVYLGTGLTSKVATVALLCFFPVFVNTVAGIAGADQRLLDLYRTSSASRWRMLVDVKLPSALDQILASLQIVVVLSLVGCVVSEFVAAAAGLGYVIKLFANELNVEIMFAAIISLAAIGATLGASVLYAQRKIIFWRGAN